MPLGHHTTDVVTASTGAMADTSAITIMTGSICLVGSVACAIAIGSVTNPAILIAATVGTSAVGIGTIGMTSSYDDDATEEFDYVDPSTSVVNVSPLPTE